MTRPLRNVAQGCTHHCYTTCRAKKYLLLGHYGKKYFIESIKMCQEKYDFELIAAEIVGNHIHLVIRTLTDKENISQIMQFIKSRIAEKYNRDNRTCGPFWNERFGSKVIEETENPQQYLLYLLWYIGYNPVRKKLSGDPRKNEIGFIRCYLSLNTQIEIKITIHHYFHELGSGFDECVNKFLYFEEAYRKRLAILF